MAKVTSLSAGRVLLTFDCDDNDWWCHVTLSIGSSNSRLGAEVLQNIVRKFLDILVSREHLEPMEGDIWTYLLSLWEDHCSIYVHKDGDVYRFKVFDADANEISEFAITEDEAQRWQSELRAWPILGSPQFRSEPS